VAAHRRVLAHQEESPDLAVVNGQGHRLLGVVAVYAGQMPVAVLVFGRCRVAVPGFQQTYHELGKVVPGTLPRGTALQVSPQGVVILPAAGLSNVAGEQVVQCGDVGGSLDGGVASEGLDAASRAADVAQQQLEYPRCSDHLRPGGVLRPANGVADAAGPLPSRVLGEDPRNLRHLFGGAAADGCHHLGRIPGVVPLQLLKDAERVLERGVTLPCECIPRRGCSTLRQAILNVPVGEHGADSLPPVLPGVAMVALLLPIQTGEHPFEILRVAVLLPQQLACVGIVDHVLLEPEVVLQDVADQAAQEGDVRAGPDGDVEIRHGRSTGEARVDVDHLRTPAASLHHEPEAHRVALRHVRAHYQDGVAVGQIPLVGCSGPPTECGAQTGHR